MEKERNYSRMDAIIDFAIEEEIKARKLYSDTAGKAGNPSLKALLENLANMEKEHEAKLKAFKEDRAVEIGEKKIEDLKIGDYLVDVDINESSSIQDILIFAIKCEKKAHDLYMTVRDNYVGTDDRDLFEALAKEEMTHKNDLEKAYDDEVYKEN